MTTISAIFENHKSASKAIGDLKIHGFDRDDLTVLTSENSADLNIKLVEETKLYYGISVGAVLGGIIGVAVSSFTGGMGFILDAPIIASLAGAGAGTLIGGLVGGFIGFQAPKNTRAKFVEEKTGKGYVMLGIKVDSSREEEIASVFKEHRPAKVTIH